jgi:hypothetical protein
VNARSKTLVVERITNKAILYSLTSKILVILALNFYIYVQIDDNKSRHIYKTNIILVRREYLLYDLSMVKETYNQ